MNEVLQKLILFTVVIPLFLSGCATTTPQSTVIDNQFQSMKPELTINLSPEFVYVGFFSQKEKFVGEFYMFVSTSIIQKNVQLNNLSTSKNENEVTKGITIAFRKTNMSFRSDLVSNIKNKLYSGVEIYAGKNYQYAITKVYPSMNASVPKFVFEKGGYVIPSCILQKGIRRVVGNRADTMIEIGYYENIKEYGFTCSAFPISGNALNQEEIEFIEEFEKRSKIAFEIINSK